MKIILFFIGLLLSGANIGMELPKEERVPGGVALVTLATNQTYEKGVFFQGHRVAVTQSNKEMLAVVGIPLNAHIGEHHLTDDQQRSVATFRIADKAYPTQPLTVAPKYVAPPPEVAERIARESALMKAAFETFSTPLPETFKMRMPAQGPESSAFGLRRVFNGEPRNPHSGLDIAAPDKSSVIAPAAGKVLLTGDFYFNGNTVIVDHGGGLLSLYCHLSEIKVSQGDLLSEGHPIGAVGATGRVTGPHLHFSVNLTGARVDPSLFIVK